MPFNVLITAASRRVALVEGFKRALAASGGGRVIVTDINPLSPAVHVADRAYLVPLSDDPTYLDEIAAICEAEAVRLVVPTIDDELELFAAARERFLNGGVRVAVSSPSSGQWRNTYLIRSPNRFRSPSTTPWTAWQRGHA